MLNIVRPITSVVAVILLAIVVFSVPFNKSVYFLKATSQSQGNITFGTFGYCIQVDQNTTCTHPSVGYELDINALVGNTLNIQIPNVVVKFLTIALFLHVIALIAAAVSTILSTLKCLPIPCFGSCFSGLAATVTFVAFIFDLVFFGVTKARINHVHGYAAQIGNAVWLTMVAFLVLVVGTFLGICC